MSIKLWIEHNSYTSGRTPPLDGETVVEVRMGDGDVCTGKAKDYNWAYLGTEERRIVAYRIPRDDDARLAEISTDDLMHNIKLCNERIDEAKKEISHQSDGRDAYMRELNRRLQEKAGVTINGLKTTPPEGMIKR